LPVVFAHHTLFQTLVQVTLYDPPLLILLLLTILLISYDICSNGLILCSTLYTPHSRYHRY
jgi:hypothetical protein